MRALTNLAERGDDIQANIRYQELLLHRIRKYYEILKDLPGYIGKCDIRRSAEFVRYLNRYNTIYDNDSELQALSRQWLKYMPFSRRYFEVPEDGLMGEGDDYAWGFQWVCGMSGNSTLRLNRLSRIFRRTVSPAPQAPVKIVTA